jgi:hypothetical protein
MNQMENLIKINSEECGQLNCVSHNLLMKAQALYSCGNKDLAEQLEQLSRIVTRASTNIDQAIGEALNDFVQRANDSTTNMFNACLAGAAIATSNPEERKSLKKLVQLNSKKE